MAKNDKLNRDMAFEKARAEEARQAVKMAEAKLEQLEGEYEGRLQDATNTKTLLKRRERQLADTKAQIEGEKARADAAVESERAWREEMDREKEENTRRVETAESHAGMMEARNNVMTKYWKDQHDEVNLKLDGQRRLIETIVKEREEDDRKMALLKGVCEQQTELIEKTVQENEKLRALFEGYKREQEEALRWIKEGGARIDDVFAGWERDSKKALDELRWALAVKKNVEFSDDEK